MDVFGSFSLILAFACAVYAVSAGIAAIWTRNAYLIKSARHAGIAVTLLVALGTACLVYLFLTDDFSMGYVAAHSNRDLPTIYKIAALWSGQEGSLLFWTLLLSVYTFFVLVLNRDKHPELMPYVGVVLCSVLVFFLILNNFIVSPFHVLGTMAGDVSPHGCFDMAGNVMEWTATLVEVDDGEVRTVIKGGSWAVGGSEWSMSMRPRLVRRAASILPRPLFLTAAEAL